jgi:hypothetical protein
VVRPVEASAEFGFRFERLLKRKDQIGFVR